VARKQAFTITLSAARVAFGVALVAFPSRVGTSWLGPDGERRPAQVALRGLGARDLALAGGAAWAAVRGSAVRPWLVATVGGDLADVAATLAAGDSLPRRSRTGTLALAGGSALLGTALAVAVDE
jgi:hypothetical protein